MRATPEKGKANKALILLIAKWLGIAKTDISLKSGSKSRLKILAISGNTDETAFLITQTLEKTGH